MSADRGHPDHTHAESPWATGDVPVTPDPPQIVWQQQAVDGRRIVDSDPAHSPTSEDPPGPPRPSRTRRWVWASAGIAATLVLAAVVWPRGGDGSATDLNDTPSTDVPATSTNFDTLPRSTDTEPSGDTPEDSSGAIESIELPPSVAAIDQPSELVVHTQNGQVHTVSLPSGRVRTVDLSGLGGPGFEGYFGGQFFASPDASLVVVSGVAFVVPRTGPVRQVDPQQFATTTATGTVDGGVQPDGWISTEDGSSAFPVLVYGPNGPRRFVVDLDGSATEVDQGIPRNSSSFPALGGDRFTNDAGGAYRISLDGTISRVSPGLIVARSREQFLVRECDDALNCGYVMIPTDATNDERRRIVDQTVVDQLNRISFDGSISPDGSLVTGNSFDTGEVLLVDLESGTIENSLPNSFSVWAPDSSGVFLLDWDGSAGLSFYDRSSGDVIEFGEDLGSVAAIAMRSPVTSEPESPVLVQPITLTSSPAGPIGLDLVALDVTGSTHLLDLDDATSTSWQTPPIRGAAHFTFSDGTRVLAVSPLGKLAYISDFGTATLIPEPEVPQGPLFPGPAEGLIWARHPTASAQIDQIALAPFGDGESTGVGARITLPNGDLLGADGAGGLVIAAAGDIFTSQGEGLTKLTGGQLVAIGPTTAFVRECDAEFACALQRVDRATGERSPVVSQTAIVFASAIESGREVSIQGSVSPDGDVAFVSYPGTTEVVGEQTGDDSADVVDKWAFFDLGSGRSALVPEPLEAQPIVWNSDSSYAAIATEDGIVLFERATASIIHVNGTIQLRSVVAVDAAFAPQAE